MRLKLICMLKKLAVLGTSAVALAPLAVFGQAPQPPGGGTTGGTNTTLTSLDSIFNWIVQAVGALVPFMLTLAVLFFLWGLANFILAAGDESARESGRSIMIWGVIAITVMVSLWGLVALLQSLFSINTSASYTAPVVQTVTI